MQKRWVSVAGVLLTVLLSSPVRAQAPAIADIQHSKVCSTTSTMAIAGRNIGASQIKMSNDGEWCWLTLWGTAKGTALYVPTFRVTQLPAHGEMLMGEVNNRARIAYRPAPGFVGVDAFTIVDRMSNIERAVTINVSP
jgi:hypothetical protein